MTVNEAITMYLVIIFINITTAVVRIHTYEPFKRWLIPLVWKAHNTCYMILTAEVMYVYLTVQLYYSWFLNFTCGTDFQPLIVFTM